MPLRAIVDNKDVSSIDLSSQEWTDLKIKLKKGESSVILPCCNKTGFLRTSSKGLNHFVHSRNTIDCNWEPETPQHLRAKVEIIKACQKNGWEAISEYSQNDWRADVLAIKNHKKIAFEVQWSKQSLEKTKVRQERYKQDDVRGCWFFRTFPKEMLEFDDEQKADKEIPMFKISEHDNAEIKVSLGKHEKGLFEFVDDLLNKRLRFCEHYSAIPDQDIEIIFYELECLACRKKQHSYFTTLGLKSFCNNYFQPWNSLRNDDDVFEFLPIVIKTVNEILISEEGKNIKLGAIKGRYKNTLEATDLSFRCYYCDAIFWGNWIFDIKSQALTNKGNLIIRKKVKIKDIKEVGPHWCYSDKGEFCE